MIDFFVCDDEEDFLDYLNLEIQKGMIDKKHPYNVHRFTKYNKEFKKWINTPCENKVYILDIYIKGQTENGIDIAREIRKNDASAKIILISQEAEKYKDNAVGSMLEFLGYIDKSKNESLKRYIDMALLQLENDDALKYEFDGEYYCIKTADITYITTDKVSKNSIIKGTLYESPCPYSLAKLNELLGPEFISLHRSYLVNRSRVFKFSFKKKVIIFDDGNSVEAISKKLTKKDFLELINS